MGEEVWCVQWCGCHGEGASMRFDWLMCLTATSDWSEERALEKKTKESLLYNFSIIK